MRLREWDPGAADVAELESWLAAYNQALAADLPGDPPWRIDRLRDYLSVTMPDERRLTWLAEAEGSSEVLGYGRLLITADLGVIELFVTPSARGSGIGAALLAAVAGRAVQEGYSTLGIEVAGGTPAAGFYSHYGFKHAYTELRSILDTSTVDWTRVAEMAAAIAPGYEIEFHPIDLPDALLPAYAEAKQVRQAQSSVELELRPSSYDAQRLRTSLRCLNARGLVPFIVVAMHQRSGAVAALTELVVPALHPSRADQYDTTIVPAHDGYGLARAVKARMLLELRRARPDLLEVQTWHTAAREQLWQVNKELGFRPDREWLEYEADAGSLLARLANLSRPESLPSI